MKIKTITCPLCGNTNQDNFIRKDNQINCKYCNAGFFVDMFDDFNEKLTTFFNEQKQEKIANIRYNLWTAVHKEYKSNEQISLYARELKMLSPDDFLANFYDIACNGNSQDINNFLNDINDYKNMKPFIEDIVEFMLTSFDEKNILALKNLIMNTFDNKEKTDYLTTLENECQKLDNGIYTSFIPRDVFVAYSSKDMIEVNKIVEYLESQGISCYLALRNLRHGKGSVENYQNELKTAMSNCKCLLYISSTNSRSLGCDALKIELKHIQEYLPKMKRIEYILEDYDTTTPFAVKVFLKNFFKDLEHCRTLDDLSVRVFNYITELEDDFTIPKKQEPKTKEEKTQYKFCQKCGSQNQLMAKFCKNCGYNVFFDTKEEYDKAKDMLYCKDCNKLNDIDSKFCLNCGSKNLVKFSEAFVEKKSRTSKTTKEKETQVVIQKETDEEKSKELKIEKSSQTKTEKPLETKVEINKEEPKKVEVQKKEEPKKEQIKEDKVKNKELTIEDIKERVNKSILQYNKGKEKNNINTYKLQYEDFNLGIKHNIPEAYTYIGILYYNGQGVAKNHENAFQNFKKASKLNDDLAGYYLGKCYFEGFGVEQDYQKAFSYFEKAVNKNNLDAIRDLAVCYEKGLGTDINYEKAFTLYEKLLDIDDTFSQIHLADFYRYGKGVKQDYEKSANLYLKLWDKNVLESIKPLAEYYFYGKGVNQDYKKSYNFYKLLSDSESVYMQSRFFFEGLEKPVDIKKAVELCETSAKRGNPDAQGELADCYFNGRYYAGVGVAKNIYEALYWYNEAVKNGNIKHCLGLGKCYFYGQGVEQDYSQAIKWFSKVVNSNESTAEAEYFLGVAHYNLNKNKKCVEILESAYNKGYKKASIQLADIYFNGSETVERNEEKGVKYYKVAAEEKDKEAMFIVGYWHYNGYYVEKSEKKACTLYKESADLGYAPAQNAYADCLFDGIGVKENKKQAGEYYKKAAKQNHPAATMNYAFCILEGLVSDRDYIKYIIIYREDVAKYYEKAINLGANLSESRLTKEKMKEVYALLAKEYANEYSSTSNEKCFQSYLKAAELGDYEAAYQTGYRYFNKKDYDEAIKWLKVAEQKASHSTSMSAKVYLGYCYEETSEYEKAAEIYREMLNGQDKYYQKHAKTRFKEKSLKKLKKVKNN